MLISMEGLVALRKLRMELQEDAGDEFPAAVLRELLVLYDVCKLLQLNLFQCQDVLGDSGWHCVNGYISRPIGASTHLRATR